MNKHRFSIYLLLGLITLSACNHSSSNSSISPSNSNSTTNSSITDVSISEITFRLRGDNVVNYANHALWIWEDGFDGELFIFTQSDAYGGYITLPIDTWETRSKLNYIVRPANTWAGQSPDTSIFFADFSSFVTAEGEMNVYLILGESEYYFTEADATGDRITGAFFSSWNRIEIQTNAPFTSYEILAGDDVIATGGSGNNGLQAPLTSDADISLLYRVRVKFKPTDTKTKIRTVLANRLFETTKFNQEYTYTGNDLGLTFNASEAIFKVWAPTSQKIRLNIYTSGDTSSITGQTISDLPIGTYTMSQGVKGIYYQVLPLTAHRGLIGRYYTYTVTNAVGTNEVMDPYARTAGVNGVRAKIIDVNTIQPEGWDQVTFEDISSPTDLLIYELHVRDLTMDASWTGTETNRGKFKGLVESGTTYTSQDGITVATGFDHLKELGFNALQILPFYDQANNELSNKFNWGYNPLNFNVLEGQYSTNPRDGSVRVLEFKEMVQAFAEQDVRIIMDVVYNHTASAMGSNFNMLVPGYYFRLNQDGTFSDGAGVGNETKSERPMFRKFMIDSVKFWAETYKIKGFRFDLMALIDVDTMNQVRDALNEIDPDIVIYGEPWKGFSDTTLPLAEQSNTYSVYNRLNGVGGFNDAGRNGLKGENNWGNGSEYGWFQKGENDNASNVTFINRVKGMLAGKNGDYYNTTYTDPNKTVNYASAHDNLTLYDQLQGTVGIENAPNASVGINALVSFAAGIPFIHAGEEIMRTKIAEAEDEDQYVFEINGQRISHNSYKSSDFTNSFKWDRKVTYLAQFERYASMIELRKNGLSFQLESATEVQTNLGFWNSPLTYSTIAMALTKDSQPYYVFANAREAKSSGALTSIIAWGTSQDRVEVMFDSTGHYPVGTLLNGQVLMRPYQVLLVKRI
ncbi:MAG: type I pullulanase [Bacilli bacterium]